MTTNGVFCFHERLEPERNFEQRSTYCYECLIDLLAGQAFDDLINLESYQVASDYMSVYCKLRAFTGPLFHKVVKREGKQTLS